MERSEALRAIVAEGGTFSARERAFDERRATGTCSVIIDLPPEVFADLTRLAKRQGVRLAPLPGEPRVPKAKPATATKLTATKPKHPPRTPEQKAARNERQRRLRAQKHKAKPTPTPKKAPANAKPEERRRFVELRAGGMSVSDCARELKIGITTAKRWAKDAA